MAAQVAQFAIPAIIGVLSQSGLFSKQKDTTPKFQRKLIDQLLAGIQGEGPLAGQFSTDIGAFQTGVSDPLQQIFQNQIAPSIQQKAIESGQQRGTPLESQLARAGLDVQSEINKLFLPFQQGAQNRTQQTINQLLGFSPTQETSLTPLGGAVFGALQGGGLQSLFSGGGGGGGGSAPGATAGTQFNPQITGSSQLPGFQFNPAQPPGQFGLPDFSFQRKGFEL